MYSGPVVGCDVVVGIINFILGNSGLPFFLLLEATFRQLKYFQAFAVIQKRVFEQLLYQKYNTRATDVSVYLVATQTLNRDINGIKLQIVMPHKCMTFCES